MKKTLFVAIALLATACSPIVGTGNPAGFAAGLFKFDACEDYLTHVQTEALKIVNEYGLGYGYGYGGGPWPVLEGDIALSAPGTTTAAADGSFRVQGVDYSGTNLQEAGVDEPDIVKTDGERIYAVAQGKLYVLEIIDGAPAITDSLSLPTGWGEMLISGDRVLVLSNQYGGYLPGGGIAAESDYYYGGSPVSVLTEIDVTDSSAIEIVKTLYLDGAYLSARMTGDVARIVVRSQPTGFVWEYPEGGGLRAITKAREANREIIRNSTVENWIPYYILENADGSTEEGLLIDCADAYHPEEFSGLGMLTVVTVDLSEGLVPNGVGVLAEGDTIYASAESLYVASQKWIDWQNADAGATEGVVTSLHKFDISDPNETKYRASGEVDGFLLNQFSLSEHEGYLRVATTSQPQWWGGSEESESSVAVLAENDGVLDVVGLVGGLGKGERIFSVRFIGDVGYVVTFRQTDPLYTLNLSDPTNPTVEGELKILGYSAYLHPLGDGLLLGVGQDATEQGRTLGTQISIFDVSDPANPTRLHKYTMAGASSNVEFDHRAFLYWAPTATAVLPMQRWGWDELREKDDSFIGAIGLQIDRDRGIQEQGTITHGADWYANIQRTLIIDGVVYSVSEQGIGANDLATFDQLSFVAF